MTQTKKDASDPKSTTGPTTRIRFQQMTVAVLCLLSLGFFSAAVMLPGPTAISENVNNLHEVALASEEQIASMESSLQVVSNSATQGSLQRLAAYTRALQPALENTAVDFEHLKATSNVIGNMADGLQNFSEHLEPEHIDSLASGVGAVAGYLEQVEPISKKLADGLTQYAKSLDTQSAVFSETITAIALKESEINAMEKSLKDAAIVLNGVSVIFTAKFIADIRKTLPSFQIALKDSISTVKLLSFGSSQEKRVLAVNNMIKNIDAFNIMLAAMEKQAPQINAAARSFSNVLSRFEKTLSSVKPLLLKLPQIAAQTAAKLPALANDLSTILRNTSDFKEVAGFMRQAESDLRESRKTFTGTQAQIKDTVVLLEGMKTQLDSAYDNREEIEANYARMIALTKSTVDGVPVMIENVELTMDTGIRTLTNLRTNISATRNALPKYQSVAVFWMVTFRIGLALIGLVFAGQSFWGFQDLKQASS